MHALIVTLLVFGNLQSYQHGVYRDASEAEHLGEMLMNLYGYGSHIYGADGWIIAYRAVAVAKEQVAA